MRDLYRYKLLNSIDAEGKVYDFISKLCDDNELVYMERNELQYISKDISGGNYIPDLYLPQGCSVLGFPRKTIVEVKHKLQSDTLYRLKKLYDKFNNNFIDGGYTFIVVYFDLGNFPENLIDRFNGNELHVGNEGFFKVYSFEELRIVAEQRRNINDDEKIDNGKLPIIDKAYQVFSKGPNTLFLGAGVSMSANLPSWKELLEKLLDKAHKKGVNFKGSHYEQLFKEGGYSSIVLGRFVQNLFNDKSEMDAAIHQILYKKKKRITSHTIRTICKIIKKKKNLVTGVITYNYDDLIEQCLTKLKVGNYSVCDNNEPEVSFPVCHVHGLLTQKNPISSTIVLSEKEYHEIYSRAYHWSNVEQLHALQRTNCFFIGLSMNDPNLRRLLDIAKGEGSKRNTDIRHFAFIDKDGIGESFNTQKERDEYCNQQENILKDLGVGIIWYHDYKTLPQELLKLI